MNDVGLKRGTVELREHNPKWKEIFEEEKQMLLGHFPGQILEVSHGGSTAIPKMPAKPIIDMFAVVPALRVAEDMRSELEKLGYHYRGEEGVSGRILYAKGEEEKRTHHLQLVEREGDQWKNHLLIKNYYLQHPEVAEEYALLKQELAVKYPENRSAYSKGKNEFVQAVIAKAKTNEV